MNKRIIAISGRKNSGKTTIINLCKEKYGYDILYFSDIDTKSNQNSKYYIEKMREIIKSYKGNKICIGDCNYIDEKKMIEEIGGETWIVVCPTDVNISNDISETSLSWDMFENRIIINNNIDTLEKKWCDYIETNRWDSYIDIYKNQNDIYNQLKNPFVISFVKNPTKANAKKMLNKIKNPLLLEDLKLLLN